MPIKFTYALLNYLRIYQYYHVNNASPSMHIHTPPLFQVELEKDS